MSREEPEFLMVKCLADLVTVSVAQEPIIDFQCRQIRSSSAGVG